MQPGLFYYPAIRGMIVRATEQIRLLNAVVMNVIICCAALIHNIPANAAHAKTAIAHGWNQLAVSRKLSGSAERYHPLGGPTRSP